MKYEKKNQKKKRICRKAEGKKGGKGRKSWGSSTPDCGREKERERERREDKRGPDGANERLKCKKTSCKTHDRAKRRTMIDGEKKLEKLKRRS